MKFVVERSKYNSLQNNSRRLPLLAAVLAIAFCPAIASGCGSSAESKPDAAAETVKTAPARWPDVNVTQQSVKTATAQTLGYTVTATIPLVRTTEVQESSPGHYNLTVKYNQPGMCHAASAVWRVSMLEQSTFELLGVLFQNPSVDKVEVEGYATPDATIDDPAQFERISRIVVERSKTTEVSSWEAMGAYKVLRKISTEFWTTPKAEDDTAKQL